MGRKEKLDDFIAAFGCRLREEHPNPERVGCPGQAALTWLATESTRLGPNSILDHVRRCAPCLDELRELRASSKHPKQ